MTKNMINYHQNTTPKYYQETHYKYVKNSGFKRSPGLLHAFALSLR